MIPRRLAIPRRFIATLASFTLAISGLLVVVAAPASSTPQTTRAFTSVYTANVAGGVLIRGNTMETCLAGSTGAAGAAITCEAAQAGGSQQNNNYKMVYVDTDGTSGNTTFDSSSATVTIPTGASVLYAALSWGAVTTAGSLASFPALTGVAAPNVALKTSASFQAPGASAYSTVTSTTTDTNGGNYQAFADVTSAVQAAGSGVYTVANVQAGTGAGNYAGWSLAIAYGDPTAPVRNLTIFTGYNSVSTSVPSVDIPVSGFLTPATGAVKTTVGAVSYEGDKGSTGDGLSIGSTALFNSLNPVNDVFNSSITDLNVAVTDRTPSYANTLGFDIDRFDATGALANGSTSTTIHLTTSSETYYPGMVTFATDLYGSALSAAKTVTDVNGGSINRNDVLSYSVTVTNGGGDGAVATVLTDTVPLNTTYVAGSLTVGGATVTDASGDDTGEVSAGNLTARLGTGATSLAGGLLSPAASSTVTFRVTVSNSVADGTSLANTASFSSNAQTTGTGTAGASNTVTSTVVVPPLPNGTVASPGEVGAAYSSGLSQTGGTGPYAWDLSAGTLPPGLTISSSTGLITGTPTTTGTSNFTLRVTDANSHTGTKAQSITIIAGPTVTFAPGGGEVGAAYSAQPTVSGGTGPYVWSLTSGTTPGGTTINSTTGAITGTPTTAGTSTFTVQALDANGVSDSKAVSIVIIAGPAVTFAPGAGEVGIAYSAQPTVSAGTSPYTWSVSTGTLPAGLSISASTGLISGTPTAAGTTSITVRATDANTVSDSKAADIVIVAGPTLTFAAPPSGEVSVGYSDQLTFTGGITPYTWSLTAGSLPAGLTLGASTGLVSGTPTTAGSSTFTVKILDVNGKSDTKAASIVVVAAPAVTFAPAAGEVGIAYSAQPTVSAGTSPYTWSVSTGTLPAGLSISASTGLISGTPTAAGTAGITVRATDANTVSDSQAGSIVIVAAPSLTFPAPPAGELGAAYSDQLTKSGGVGPFTWSVTAGSLPTGVTLNASTGLLSGTPSADGTFAFTVKVLDANGAFDTKAATVVIGKISTSVSLSVDDASVHFGTSVTLSATVGPAGAGGTVTFTDLLSSGPQSGTTVTLDSRTLSSGAASLQDTLPAFGVNTITAHYEGDSTHAAADSSATAVEVSAYQGELIVTEFRTSGPSGANDSYIELYNSGPVVPMAGFKVSTSSGTTTTLPADAGDVAIGGSYLITGQDFSLGAIATSDFAATSLGTGGVEIVAPDTALTQTDAVGPASDFHLGTGLSPMTASPNAEYAWVRREVGAIPVDTRDNAADFVLVSRTGAQVGGVPSTIGSASPTGTADPFQNNGGMTSKLLNTGVAIGAPPNRIIVPGSPGTLTVQRTITNTSGGTITSAKVRVTALSEANGPPEPGVPSQPARIANLHVINAVATGSVHPDRPPTQELTLDFPATTGVGGLNSTWTLTLPNGGLAPGDSINVAFTFAIESHGTFWFGYDVDTIAGNTGDARHSGRAAHASVKVARNSKPGDSGQIR